MCRMNNGVRITDCNYCNCGQSSKHGEHTPQKSGSIRVGNVTVPVYTCRKCGTYLGTS